MADEYGPCYCFAPHYLNDIDISSNGEIDNLNGASFEDGYFGEFDDVYDVKLLSFGQILQEPGAAYAYYKASLDTLYYETDGDWVVIVRNAPAITMVVCGVRCAYQSTAQKC